MAYSSSSSSTASSSVPEACAPAADSSDSQPANSGTRSGPQPGVGARPDHTSARSDVSTQGSNSLRTVSSSTASTKSSSTATSGSSTQRTQSSKHDDGDDDGNGSANRADNSSTPSQHPPGSAPDSQRTHSTVTEVSLVSEAPRYAECVQNSLDSLAADVNAEFLTSARDSMHC